MFKRPILFLSAFVLLTVFSCTLQKRQYMPGFYLHWKEKADKPAHKAAAIRDRNVTIANTSKADTVRSMTEQLLASAGKEPLIIPFSKSLEEGNDVDCGDSLFLRSGTKSRVRILEVTETEVIFKRCANLNGPELTVNKNDVQKIRYQSGNIETFKEIKKNDLKKIIKGEAKFANDT